MTNMIQAIIYTRTSTTRQSSDRQINELKNIEGYKVVKTFTETISGYTKSIHERPKLQAAIKYMIDHDIKMLMVHEISRLGRKTAEVLTLINELKEKGIKIYIKSLDMVINDNSAAENINVFAVTLLADLARMESENLSYRIKSGLEERKRKGYAVGRQFGSTESKEKYLKKYQKVIKRLEEGSSIREIAAIYSISPTTVQKVKSTYMA
jgi:DNA invertase Pin-like site-specific DNA recombinase